VFDRFKDAAARSADVKKGVDALFTAENLQGLPSVFGSLGLLRDEKGKTVFRIESGALAEVMSRIPEQGGRDLISTDPLSPGTVYTAGITSEGTVGLYRLEVSVSSGTGKLKMAGGVSGVMKESVQRAFSYIQAKKAELGIARDLDTADLHVEVIDLLGNRAEAEIGVALFVAAYSALRRAPVSPALLVLGDMSVQGNIKPLRSLSEPLQVAKDNGAKRALIPIENKRNFLDVRADIMEYVDPIFYSDPKMAAMKVV
jgi:ATP-dependent Lon protease